MPWGDPTRKPTGDFPGFTVDVYDGYARVRTLTRDYRAVPHSFEGHLALPDPANLDGFDLWVDRETRGLLWVSEFQLLASRPDFDLLTRGWEQATTLGFHVPEAGLDLWVEGLGVGNYRLALNDDRTEYCALVTRASYTPGPDDRIDITSRAGITVWPDPASTDVTTWIPDPNPPLTDRYDIPPLTRREMPAVQREPWTFTDPWAPPIYAKQSIFAPLWKAIRKLRD